MKPHKLLLILSFMLFSVGNTFAQNNDMKARMEFEDAETAYQNQDYSKAVTHLESAEKLLGKPTGKTRYLLILALNKRLPVDYEYKDLEKIKKLSKHYLENYTTDTEKYREIYDLSNYLDKNFPKTLAEYNQIKQEKQENLRLAQEKKQQKEKQEAEELKQAQDYVKSLAQKYGGFVSDITLDEFAKKSPAHREIIDDLKKKILKNKDPFAESKDHKEVGPLRIWVNRQNTNMVSSYEYNIQFFKKHTPQEVNQIFQGIIKEIKENLPAKYYKEAYGSDCRYVYLPGDENRPYFLIKVPGLNIFGILIDNFRYNGYYRYTITFYSNNSTGTSTTGNWEIHDLFKLNRL